MKYDRRCLLVGVLELLNASLKDSDSFLQYLSPRTALSIGILAVIGLTGTVALATDRTHAVAFLSKEYYQCLCREAR